MIGKDVSNLKIGVGVDVEEIDRFRLLDKKKDNIFLKKIFTNREIDYCFNKRDCAPSLAVRFAAKEAILKAIADLGLGQKVSMLDIEIVVNSQKVPKAKIVVLEKKVGHKIDTHVSLSHSRNEAIAFTVIYVIRNLS